MLNCETSFDIYNIRNQVLFIVKINNFYQQLTSAKNSRLLADLTDNFTSGFHRDEHYFFWAIWAMKDEVLRRVYVV